MTFDEMLAECEARRVDKRYQPVVWIDRKVPRRVTLERCACAGCEEFRLAEQFHVKQQEA